MKTLFLLRHAKSDWSSAGLSDHDRPLNKRGRDAAPKMGTFLERHHLKPDIVRCSSAKRTRQTLKAVKPFLPDATAIDYSETLYHASASIILNDIVKLADEFSTALYVGHNPGFHDLALRLVGEADNAQDLAHLHAKFPTAGLAVIAFDVDHWKNVTVGTGQLKLFVYPKSLP